MIHKILDLAASCAPLHSREGLALKLNYSAADTIDDTPFHPYSSVEEVTAACLILFPIVLAGLLVLDTLNLRALFFDGAPFINFVIEHFYPIQTLANLLEFFLILSVSALLLVVVLFFLATKFAVFTYILSVLILFSTMLIAGDIAMMLDFDALKGMVLIVIAFIFFAWRVDHPDFKFKIIARTVGILFLVLAFITAQTEILEVINSTRLTGFAKFYIPLVFFATPMVFGCGLGFFYTALTKSSSSKVNPALTASFALLLVSGLFLTCFLEVILTIIFSKKKSSSS